MAKRPTKQPNQDQYFGPRNEDELEHLAKLIREHVADPIEVSPDGTILSGHNRFFAIRSAPDGR